ncbi:MAG: VOC family protein [Chlamydiae bacterium]|nr:VOC family protein [Chlamydiota bacterium]MBI3265536.1 VOC family protein [Chlamydiota bacterium]
MKRPPLLGIRHIALKVRDIRKSEEFYTRLGFQVEWRPDGKNLYLSSGQDNLALHQVSSKISSIDGTLDHFGLLVRIPEEVDEWAEYLRSSGLKFMKEPKTHRDGARSFYFQDPDGNVIQILYHPPISKKL